MIWDWIRYAVFFWRLGVLGRSECDPKLFRYTHGVG